MKRGFSKSISTLRARSAAMAIALLLCTGLTSGRGGAGEITADGEKLGKWLDGLEVEKLWLAGDVVDFETGIKIRAAKTRVTHCSAFVAVACNRLDLYVLRPPKHEAKLLANAQASWLASKEGKEFGWSAVKSGVQAQRLANQGKLVVVSYQEKDDARPGHIAIVRPSRKADSEIEMDGPQIIQAGMTNSNSTTVRDGFKNHKGAWPEGVRYHVHELDWSRVK